MPIWTFAHPGRAGRALTENISKSTSLFPSSVSDSYLVNNLLFTQRLIAPLTEEEIAAIDLAGSKGPPITVRRKFLRSFVPAAILTGLLMVYVILRPCI
jgi:hypothetical protein